MMSSYYQFNNHQHPAIVNPLPATHTHHAGRSRRAPRPPTVQNNAHKAIRLARTVKDVTNDANITFFRQKFEAGRSFDLDDDLEFCPGLLTDEDLSSIQSNSDRSSLSSGSPESSPTQQPNQVAFTLNSQSAAYIPSSFQHSPNMKFAQPAARFRGIPIVNPATGVSMAPSPVASPARMQAQTRRY